MKIYKKTTVYEESLERIRFLFSEFETVAVGISGGKDSTVCLELSLKVAKELDRLPLKVMWIDQEAEWQATVDYCAKAFKRPEIEPYWLQMPMVITNNASSYERYAQCWKAGEDWIHPQNPISIKENKYGTDRFHDLFAAFLKVEFPVKTCYISGVRTEETPKRFMSITGGET